MRNHNLYVLFLAIILSLSMYAKAERKQSNDTIMNKGLSGKSPCVEGESDRCVKQTMQFDGIVRLSKIEVYPEYLDEYIKFAIEVGEISLRTEPGVLTMYAVQEKENHWCYPIKEHSIQPIN